MKLELRQEIKETITDALEALVIRFLIIFIY